MPKDQDRRPHLPDLPDGWQFDPPQISDPQTNANAAYKVSVSYILLPDNAMPLIPLSSVVIAYLAARQINAFLRSL
jgi:hypothetical protein